MRWRQYLAKDYRYKQVQTLLSTCIADCETYQPKSVKTISDLKVYFVETYNQLKHGDTIWIRPCNWWSVWMSISLFRRIFNGHNVYLILLYNSARLIISIGIPGRLLRKYMLDEEHEFA